MWRSTIIFFLSFFSSTLRSQIVISNLSLTDTTQNIFYIGVENIIHVTGKGYDPLKGKFAVSGGGCTSKNLGNGNYIYKCEIETDDCTLWYSENGKLVYKQNFRCRKIVTDPVARLAGVRDSLATVEEITSNPFLIVEMPNTLYKHGCRITAFTFTMDGASFEEKNEVDSVVGHIIPAHVINKIKKLRKGYVIAFDQLRCLCNDSRTRKLKPFRITIK